MKDSDVWLLLIVVAVIILGKEAYTTVSGLPYEQQVKDAVASFHDVPASLVMAVIETESSFNSDAFLEDRNGGSYGLMQLDYPTARGLGYAGTPDGLYDPDTNIYYGVKYLHNLYAELKSWEAAIMSYNEGPGNFLAGVWDDVYYAKVNLRWEKWKTVMGV